MVGCQSLGPTYIYLHCFPNFLFIYLFLNLDESNENILNLLDSIHIKTKAVLAKSIYKCHTQNINNETMALFISNKVCYELPISF